MMSEGSRPGLAPDGSMVIAPPPSAFTAGTATTRTTTTTTASTVIDEENRYPYDDMGDDDDGHVVHDQMPTVEEIRNQAAMSLARAESASSVTTIQQHRHRAKQRRWTCYWGIATILLVVVLILGLSLGLTRRNDDDNNDSNESRVEDVLQWLMDHSITSRSQLEILTSPQYRAATWIADEDPRRLRLPSSSSFFNRETISLEFVERYALTVLYYALDGPAWTYRWKFVTAAPTCGWNELVRSTDDREFRLGASCDGTDRISMIHIPQSRLAGSIPSELGLLTDLSFLAMNHNNINGTIPTSMEAMTKLDYFALHWNDLQGTLPYWLGQSLTNLRVLGLGNNNLVGSIPQSFSRFSNMLTLGLDDNLLTGTLSPLATLNKMERMYLEDNQFVQDLNTLGFGSMSNLEEADLSDNAFRGTLPDYLFQMTKLQILDFHDNYIEALPASINTAASNSLIFMALHKNKIAGPLPTLSGFPNLSHLDLAENEFTGMIPNSILQLTKLRYLFLSSNPGLTAGSIPDLTRLSNLQDLSLKETNRQGPIPSYLSTFTNMILLDFDNNQLTGTIPSSLGDLSNLSFLLLNRNEALTGPVPTSVQQLPKLQILLLDRTSITGSLDPVCGRDRIPSILASDCDGLVPEIQCECCTVCCDDTQEENCDDQVYLGQLDPVWENSYNRNFYQFAPEVIFG